MSQLFGSRTCQVNGMTYAVWETALPLLTLRAPERFILANRERITLTGISFGGRWSIHGMVMDHTDVLGVVKLLDAPQWQDIRHAPRYALNIPCAFTVASQKFCGTTQDCSYDSLAWVTTASIDTLHVGSSLCWTLHHSPQDFLGQGVCVRTHTTGHTLLIVAKPINAVSTQNIIALLAQEKRGEV